MTLTDRLHQPRELRSHALEETLGGSDAMGVTSKSSKSFEDVAWSEEIDGGETDSTFFEPVEPDGTWEESLRS